jgi:hypothetical protein
MLRERDVQIGDVLRCVDDYKKIRNRHYSGPGAGYVPGKIFTVLKFYKRGSMGDGETDEIAFPTDGHSGVYLDCCEKFERGKRIKLKL